MAQKKHTIVCLSSEILVDSIDGVEVLTNPGSLFSIGISWTDVLRQRHQFNTPSNRVAAPAAGRPTGPPRPAGPGPAGRRKHSRSQKTAPAPSALCPPRAAAPAGPVPAQSRPSAASCLTSCCLLRTTRYRKDEARWIAAAARKKHL